MSGLLTRGCGCICEIHRYTVVEANTGLGYRGLSVGGGSEA
jgi:hypothetical protein